MLRATEMLYTSCSTHTTVIRMNETEQSTLMCQNGERHEYIK